MTIKTVEKAALRLPAAARGRLAAALLDSLESDPDGISHAWVDEADRRYQAYRKGKTNAIPSKQAIAAARKALKS